MFSEEITDRTNDSNDGLEKIDKDVVQQLQDDNSKR